MSDLSLLRPIGFHTSQCGYCTSNDRQKRKESQYQQEKNVEDKSNESTADSSQSRSLDEALESRAAYYVRSTRLRPDDYATLLNHGWRRSGTLLYKPEMRHSCCPHYTIRLPVRELKVRKDQRSACNKWNRFVLGQDYDREAAKLHPKNKAEKAAARGEFDLEATVHRAEGRYLPAAPTPLHKFEVGLEPASFSKEKYDLYIDYQTNVHGDNLSECDESGFKRFLCDSPLASWTEEGSGVGRKCGSFHQTYRLDGRLIAMGVLDLLPASVSAVYFVYHHDFEQFQFGKMSALREASFAREHGYEYYQMGYYIHSCGKMRYKNDFQPQYFLDLSDYSWHPLDQHAQRMMDKHHYYSPAMFAQSDKSGTRHEILADTEPCIESNTADLRIEAAKILSDLEFKHRSGQLSLFDMHFAGMQPYAEIEPFLDKILIKVARAGRLHETGDLVAWKNASYRNPRSIKGIIAELIACAGPVVNQRIIIDLTTV